MKTACRAIRSRSWPVMSCRLEPRSAASVAIAGPSSDSAAPETQRGHRDRLGAGAVRGLGAGSPATVGAVSGISRLPWRWKTAERRWAARDRSGHGRRGLSGPVSSVLPCGWARVVYHAASRDLWEGQRLCGCLPHASCWPAGGGVRSEHPVRERRKRPRWRSRRARPRQAWSARRNLVASWDCLRDPGHRSCYTAELLRLGGHSAARGQMCPPLAWSSERPRPPPRGPSNLQRHIIQGPVRASMTSYPA